MIELTDPSGQTPWITGWALLVGAPALGLVVLLVLVNPTGLLPLSIVGLLAVVALWRGWLAVRRDPMWLPFALMLFELLDACVFIPNTVRPIAAYSLTILFCFSALPVLWLAWKAHRSGFRWYLVYFGWCLITVIYSLDPVFSLARLGRALFIFAAITATSLRARETGQMRRVIRSLTLACVAVTLLTAAAAVVLPHSLTWPSVVETGERVQRSEPGQLEMVRFVGLFENPNEIGEMMLVTVGLILTYLEFAERRERIALLCVALLAAGLSAMADSRSAFVGLAVGCAAYACWKYRFRGLLFIAAVPAVAAIALSLAGRDLGAYFWRGDIWTLTGRAEMWPFVVGQIAHRPLFGYGYEVAGSIFKSRYFPLWWGPWQEGPHSSIHDGYLSQMIGLGIPATLFWLWLMLRPWFHLFREPEDKWHLKRMLFFLVIPLLVLNLDESVLGGCTGVAGFVFVMIWAVVEQRRLAALREAEAARQQERRNLPAAVAALRYS